VIRRKLKSVQAQSGPFLASGIGSGHDAENNIREIDGISARRQA